MLWQNSCRRSQYLGPPLVNDMTHAFNQTNFILAEIIQNNIVSVTHLTLFSLFFKAYLLKDNPILITKVPNFVLYNYLIFNESELSLHCYSQSVLGEI